MLDRGGRGEVGSRLFWQSSQMFVKRLFWKACLHIMDILYKEVLKEILEQSSICLGVGKLHLAFSKPTDLESGE